MNTVLQARDLTPGELRSLLEAVRPPSEAKPRIWLEGADGWALDWWPGLTGKLSWCGANREPCQRPVVELIPTPVRLQVSWAGRLFAPSGELRWRVLPALGDHCVRTVFLGTPSWGLEGLLFSKDDELNKLTRRDRSKEYASILKEDVALLWGQLTTASDDSWIQLRIPHRFHYPVDPLAPGKGRVGVRAILEVWEDNRGEPHFIRLCDLQAYREN